MSSPWAVAAADWRVEPVDAVLVRLRPLRPQRRGDLGGEQLAGDVHQVAKVDVARRLDAHVVGGDASALLGGLVCHALALLPGHQLLFK
jgi:hypothetical protein